MAAHTIPYLVRIKLEFVQTGTISIISERIVKFDKVLQSLFTLLEARFGPPYRLFC